MLAGTHHTTVFVNGGVRFNYAYFLVRRMAMLFHGLPGSFATSQVDFAVPLRNILAVPNIRCRD
jgi:hypothetical protein